MKFVLSMLFLFVLTAFVLVPARAGEVCLVDDPTGTPLNIRATPNGRVTGKLKNGTVVLIEDYASDNEGRSWARIGVNRRKKYVVLGYVLRDYIICTNR